MSSPLPATLSPILFELMDEIFQDESDPNSTHEEQPTTAQQMGHLTHVGPSTSVASQQQPARSKRKQPQNWISNIRKQMREGGKAYIDITHKRKSPREMKKPCNQTCVFLCSKIFNEPERLRIYSQFWQLSDEDKGQYYSKFVKRHGVTRRRVTQDVDKKQFSYTYYLQLDQNIHRVCRTFFVNTLSINQKRIYYNFSNLTDSKTGTPLPRKKGKHVKKVTPVEKIKEVRNHIASFPTIPSHYCRANSNRNYLESNLSVSRMYKLYTENVTQPVKMHIYRETFHRDFNISFYKPKKDQCDKCVLFKANESPSEDEKIKYENHVTEKLALKEDRDTDRSNIDPTHCIICYDMQSVFSLPKGNASRFYYKRKLNVFNLTATVSLVNIPRYTYCALWSEAHSGRSGNDKASALVKILNQCVADHPEIQRITLWSDSCIPQNKNKINSTAIKMFLNSTKNIKEIVQKFSEPGHSLIQELDCIHRFLKNLEIHSPLHLIKLLNNVNSEKVKLKIIEMRPEDFKLYSQVADQLDFSKVPFAKLKSLLYEQENEFSLKFKLTPRNMYFSSTSLFKIAGRKRLPTPTNLLNKDVNIVPKRKITKEKESDIKELLTFLPKNDQDYLKDLLKF